LKSLLAILLVSSLLLQGFGRLCIVVNYQLNQAQITELFCINKNKPDVGCQGKCYLKKQLGQAESQSVPLSSLKALLEVELFAQPLTGFLFATGPTDARPAGFYLYPTYPSPVRPVFLPPKAA
jgi:hypothetical protein